MKILGVEIDNFSQKEIITQIKDWINNSNQLHTIATVNAEMVVAANHDSKIMEVINGSDLKIPESTAIMLASIKLGHKFKQKTPGVDLIWELAKISHQTHWRWYLLGGAPDVAKQASQKLKQKYPGINIVGATDGGVVTSENIHTRTDLVEDINHVKPDILIVCFGIPKQEMFMQVFKNQLTAKIGIGAGGTLDFIAGKQKRAPKALRLIGLEWFWRLLREPKRFKRIWTATVIFPIKFIFSSTKN